MGEGSNLLINITVKSVEKQFRYIIYTQYNYTGRIRHTLCSRTTPYAHRTHLHCEVGGHAAHRDVFRRTDFTGVHLDLVYVTGSDPAAAAAVLFTLFLLHTILILFLGARRRHIHTLRFLRDVLQHRLVFLDSFFRRRLFIYFSVNVYTPQRKSLCTLKNKVIHFKLPLMAS